MSTLPDECAAAAVGEQWDANMLHVPDLPTTLEPTVHAEEPLISASEADEEETDDVAKATMAGGVWQTADARERRPRTKPSQIENVGSVPHR